MTIEVGLKGHVEKTVSDTLTAASCGSGSLPVFGTPFMLALMEEAACRSLSGHLDDGWGSVGIGMTVTHDAATPVGMKVWADSVLTQVNGRKLTFEVTAYDEAGQIGTCRQERFLVQNEKFLGKCNAKRNG